MGFINDLLQINALFALNDINNKAAKERKKEKIINRIRNTILKDKDFTFSGTYIIRVKSGDAVKYFKFHWSGLDKTTEEIYSYLTLTRKSLHELSFKYAIVRIK